MKVSAQSVINALYNPDEIVCLRVFDDRKTGIFTGAKLEVEAGKFFAVVPTLIQHNKQNRGIFFVVNTGGQTDQSITRINAQFVEMDDKTFEEQQKLIDEFALPPSMIIKTQKSLHTYWFVKNADVSRFRPIQKALVKHFGGDPACVNESRVMRLPSFYHCKKEPVLVECISFHPERKYTQNQLAEVLPVEENTTSKKPDNSAKTEVTKGTEKGLNLIINGCNFIDYCQKNAKNLSEPLWWSMITNLAPFENGNKKIHELSKSYHSYNVHETDTKILHFFSSGTKPINCRTIAEKGYKCPKIESGECKCKSPAGLAYQPPTIDTLKNLVANLTVVESELDNLQTARKFIEEYLFNLDVASANAVISHILRDKFSLKQSDLRPLIQFHKEIFKKFEVEKRTREHRNKVVEIPPWYTMSENGLKFLPDILAKNMAEEIHAFYSAEQYYYYQHGVYMEINELEAKNMVREKMLPGNTKLSQITDAEGQWRMQIQRDFRDFNANPYVINIRNGLYNVLENRLVSHNPEYLSTVQLAINYTEGADCPRFKQFLHEVLSDEQVQLVQEMLGYFLIPVNKAQKCFIVVGKAGAGKSVLLRVLNEILLGKENVSNVSWQSLNDRFKTAELFGKLANIFADLPTRNIDDNGIFKALVGEDYLTVERKNKNPFSFQPYTRLLFSCNSIPKNYGDKSEGFYRRLIIVRFNHSIPAERRDPNLIEKFRTEADGIFLFALEGLKRLMSNNFKFSETAENSEELQRYREESNSVLAFIKECCEIRDDGEVGRTELFGRYKEYCVESGLTAYSQRRFNAEIEANFNSVQRAKDSLGKRKTWRGLAMKDEE